MNPSFTETRVQPEWDDETLSAMASWGEGDQVRLNMVLDADGRCVDTAGTSAGLTLPLDRRLLREIRTSADILIVGAASVRAEGWFPITRGETLVLTAGHSPVPRSPADARVRVHTLPHLSASQLQLLCCELLSADARRILCEGGPTLARLILESGTVTSVNLTVRVDSPDLALEIARETFPPLSECTHACVVTFPDATVTFIRWRCATAAPGPAGTSLSP